MRHIRDFTEQDAAPIRYILSDLDDTLTIKGQVPSETYAAVERARNAGIPVIVVTGRPAGWCDLIARQWPVDGVIGENGAFYFRYDHAKRKMIRHFEQTEKTRASNKGRLWEAWNHIHDMEPGLALSADQDFRISDIAIDFCEDVAAVPLERVYELAKEMKAFGLSVKVSSIHINAWIGDFDKLSMTKTYFKNEHQIDLERDNSPIAYVGDSPNDEPMFRFFPCAVGVANIEEFLEQMEAPPSWITEKPGGYGFVELTEKLLKS